MNGFASLFCLVAMLSTSVLAEPTTIISDNGPASRRIDIVILGDGYTAGELGQYAADADALVQLFFLESPFDEYQSYFNVRRIDVTSNESGADHPEIDEYKDTALGAAYFCASIQRLICVDYGAVTSVLDASVGPDERDIVLILVNDSEYGGSGGAFAVASTNPASTDVMVHEIGHSFGFLGDEYEGGGPACITSVEPSSANLTLETDRNLIKWNAGGGPPTGWIDPDTPIPHQDGSPLDEPGLFDGGGYCNPGDGMYRPTDNSKMRAVDVPFGPVNSEQLVKRVYAYTNPVDSQLPTTNVQTLQLGDSSEYSIEPMRPATHSLEIDWYFDDDLVASGGESLALTSTDLTAGPHEVLVWVHDKTPLVRNDPNAIMWGSVIWTVFVATDDDIDGDGVPNGSDAFPEDPFETVDTDGDGIGDTADLDDDGDGVPDVDDDYPLGRFADAAPGYWAFTFIEALARAGITSGCGGEDYCPSSPVTRAQMAVFLERGMNGSDYSPPAATGNVFLDVAASAFAASFIEQLAADGITSGCGNNNFCPNVVVTRDQMAVFLLRAKYGSAYSPPAAIGMYSDVPLSHWAAHWIEQLAAEGITAGCGDGNYCPGTEVTRDQMAVFLVRVFGL